MNVDGNSHRCWHDSIHLFDGQQNIFTIYCWTLHDDVIKWKHFPRNWPFVRGIHRYPVNSPHKGQWRGALMFSVICVWINDWVNNREAGDLRRYRAHYDVIVMSRLYRSCCINSMWYNRETTCVRTSESHSSCYSREWVCILWKAIRENISSRSKIFEQYHHKNVAYVTEICAGPLLARWAPHFNNSISTGGQQEIWGQWLEAVTHENAGWPAQHRLLDHLKGRPSSFWRRRPHILTKI